MINFRRPIIGLSPMDSVTDAPFREMIARHSTPSFIVTEFSNVEGLARGGVKMLHAFLYSERERPIIAQIYGVEIESFYKAAVMCCFLGFDGVDINMGCPMSKVAKRGSGAALIKTPELARQIIATVKAGVRDFKNGISLEEAGVNPLLIDEVKNMSELHGGAERAREIPVSVKTRIGFDKDIAENWMSELLPAKPDMITVHGRTLKQLYSGRADWDSIRRASRVVRGAGILFLGNGDIQNMQDARDKISEFEVDGVMVGRAVQGNPWFFTEHIPSVSEKLDAIIEHSEILANMYPQIWFVHIRKHLAWYANEFSGAKELRTKLIRVSTFADVKEIVENFRKENNL
ncbi:MAG: tRNA-dihydrouridine synthase [Candidatus Gracilibacteria bacterium]|nr:tRNA-dihydrouridine synthase [Candidatus Gracilibacteria bacterium]